MKTAYCIKCGNKFPEEALFCPYCGAKIYRPDDDESGIRPEEVINRIPFSQVVKETVPVSEQIQKARVKSERESTIQEKQHTGPKHELPEDTVVEKPRENTETKVEPDKEVTIESTVESTVSVDEDELEDPKIGICILSFFFPIVGFIAASSNRGTNKKKSKTYAMWAWIGFGVGILSNIIQSTV